MSSASICMPYVYFIVQANYKEESLPMPLTTELVTVILKSALAELHGIGESSKDFTVLKVDNAKKSFIIKVPRENYVKLHSAITVSAEMIITGQRVPVSYRVLEPVADALPMLSGVFR